MYIDTGETYSKFTIHIKDVKSESDKDNLYYYYIYFPLAAVSGSQNASEISEKFKNTLLYSLEGLTINVSFNTTTNEMSIVIENTSKHENTIKIYTLPEGMSLNYYVKKDIIS